MLFECAMREIGNNGLPGAQPPLPHHIVHVCQHVIQHSHLSINYMPVSLIAPAELCLYPVSIPAMIFCVLKEVQVQ